MVTIKIILGDTAIGDIVCEQSKAYELINQFAIALHEPSWAACDRVRIEVISHE